MTYNRQEHPHSINGIAGTMKDRHLWPESVERSAGLYSSQTWRSEPRPFPEYGPGAYIRVKMRFDDNCKNGKQSFSITADIYRPKARDVDACGALHDEIQQAFPELAEFVPFHLCDTRGPMHYIANTAYHASNRDYNGLREGEEKPLLGPDKIPHWELVADLTAPENLGVKISDTPTGREYIGAKDCPIFIVEKAHKGENPPPIPRLKWVQTMIKGQGKERDLDAARNVAIWPDATDAELMQERPALEAALMERLPALVARFRALMDSVGFEWIETEASQ